MKIHTLGPKTTDSCYAYRYWNDLHPSLDIELVLHHSFTEIYNDLSSYRGDLFLVPTVYRDENSDWANYHYQYLDQLSIYDVFVLNTKPMILARNQNQNNQQIVLHQATNPFVADYENKQQIRLEKSFADSKSIAFDQFLNGGFEYAIISETERIKQHNFEVIKRYEPKIIWCVYQVI